MWAQTRIAVLSLLLVASHGALLPRRKPWKCSSLDREQVLCNRDGVKVQTTADNKRQLRFNDECAIESSVHCSGQLPTTAGLCVGGCGNCPCEFNASAGLGASYMSTMFEQLQGHCAAESQQTQVLFIGLGGGELTQFLLEKCPRMHIDAAEVNSAVIDLARNYFGLAFSEQKHAGRLVVEKADAMEIITRKAADRYDVVLVDCFMAGGEVPEACRSPSFAEGAWRVLKPAGTMLQNIWSHSPQRSAVEGQFRETLESYRHVFEEQQGGISGSVQDLRVPMPPRLNFVHILRSTKGAGATRQELFGLRGSASPQVTSL